MGFRTREVCEVYFIDGGRHYVKHELDESYGDFEWGLHSKGAQQTAASILAHAIGPIHAGLLYHEFEWEIVRAWPGAEGAGELYANPPRKRILQWVITIDEVHEWASARLRHAAAQAA